MSIHRRSNGLALVVVVGGFLLIAYGYFTFSGLNHQLIMKDDIISRITQRKNEVNNQLKVVYSHTTKLEQALKSSKEKHKETKHELLTKLNEFEANLTKTRHEAHNRFNALDTDYKMLKANYDEIQENYAALQQQYVRLSEDHKHVANEAKSDYDKLRDAKEAESISLQNRIQDLFNGKIYYQEKAKQNQEYYESTMKKYEEIKKLSQEYKERIEQYQIDIKELKESLYKCRTSSKSHDDNKNPLDDLSTAFFKTEGMNLFTKAIEVSMKKDNPIGIDSVTNLKSSNLNDIPTHFIQNAGSIFNDTSNENLVEKIPARLASVLSNNSSEFDNEQNAIDMAPEDKNEDSLKAEKYNISNSRYQVEQNQPIAENIYPLNNNQTREERAIEIGKNDQQMALSNKLDEVKSIDKTKRDAALETKALNFLNKQRELSLNKHNLYDGNSEILQNEKRHDREEEDLTEFDSEKNTVKISEVKTAKISDNKTEAPSIPEAIDYDASNTHIKTPVDSPILKDEQKLDSSLIEKHYDPVQKPSLGKKIPPVTFLKSTIKSMNINNTPISADFDKADTYRQQNQLQPLKKYKQESFVNLNDDGRQLKPPKPMANDLGARNDVDQAIERINVGAGNDVDQPIEPINVGIGNNVDQPIERINVRAGNDVDQPIEPINVGIGNNVDQPIERKSWEERINVRAGNDVDQPIEAINVGVGNNVDQPIERINVKAGNDVDQPIEPINVETEKDKIIPPAGNQLQPPNLVRIEPILEEQIENDKEKVDGFQREEKPLLQHFDGQIKKEIKNIKDVTLEDDEHGDQNLDNVNKLDNQEEKQVKRDNGKAELNQQNHRGEGLEGFEQKQGVNEDSPALNNVEKGEEETEEENEEGMDETEKNKEI